MPKIGIKIIDAHTHVQFEQFNDDRDRVVERALASGVGMINAGADMKSTKEAVDLADKFTSGVWAAAGIHPTEPKDFERMGELEKLASNNRVVGIGECGLDYFRDKDYEVQKKQKGIFQKHIEISANLKKPLIIHCREAFSDTIGILESNKNVLLSAPGILHFFTGTIDEAKKLLDLNFSFTFGGLITFNRSFDEIIKYIPLEKILVETDAPYVAPVPNRGKRNEPAFIVSVVEQLAAMKNISFDEAAHTTLQNTAKLFNLGL